MNKQSTIALTMALGILPIGRMAAYLAFLAPHVSAQTETTAKTPTPKKAMSNPPLLPTTNASAVVDAANAFLATLSEQQQTVVQTELSPRFATRWSNFPAAVVPRNGVYFRDLNPEQTEAALKVARLALSAEGFTRFQEVRAADDAFAKIDRGPGGGRRGGGPPQGGQGGPPPGGPPGGGSGGFGGPGKLFGAGNYIIAFLGKPSTTEPWLLQLGGHHLAFNLYYKGATGTSTPYFVGVQPNTWKDAAGKTHAPLAPLRDAMYELVHSLTPEQLNRAQLSARFNDVYVGPGRDGHFPALRDGVPYAELSDTTKKLLRQAISAWTNDSPQSAEYRKLYEAELDKTKVAWSGTTALSTTGDYVRIDGPRVWIEFACQGDDHYHTIWRDRLTDYGAEFSF